MVDPFHITEFHRSNSELEELIMNAIAFAGKNAAQQSKKMHALLANESGVSPFTLVRRWHRHMVLHEKLRAVRIGKYALLASAYRALAHSSIDLRTCSLEELQTFTGIGPKTARLFILHSRPAQEYVVIDTHMLKEMRSLGFTDIHATPSQKKYIELEQRYIAHLKKIGITDFAAHDLATWKKYSMKRAPKS